MPLFLLLLAVALIVSGVRGKSSELFATLKDDLSAFSNAFLAIILIGFIGYIPKAKPISTAFYVLFGIVIFNKFGEQFFNNIKEQTK